MQVLHFAVTRHYTRHLLAAAGSLAILSAAIPVVAQTPVEPLPKPSGQKPWPTLTPVSAGPDEVIHVVKKGDTLWDLAQAYLKDPFRWPEVFRRNTDIVENPHWIYPGETIRIPSSEVRPEVLARITTQPARSTDRTVFSSQPGGPVADRIGSNGEVLGRESQSGVPQGEIEGAPFGARRGGPRNSGRLAAAYDRPGILTAAGERRFQLKDRVFVNLPSGSTAAPGDLLLAYRLGPDIGDEAQLVVPTGILRVESKQPGQPALARVIRQFGELLLDQSVMDFTPQAGVVGAPISVPPGPPEKVVHVVNSPVLPSLQSYVILSVKAASGVRVGDQFTLIDDTIDPKHPAPPVPVAIAEVVKVTPYGLTAIVVDQEQPRIYAGMTARMSARAP
jgi:hypothetical protein